MMASLPTTNFLNDAIGEIGKKTSIQLPDELGRIWAPTGLSLEEINRRKEAIRAFQRELDTKVINFSISNSGAAATGTYYSGYKVPANKKVFIWAAEISYYHAETTGYGEVEYCFHNEGSDEGDTPIARVVLPPAVAGAVNPYTSHSIPFFYPVVGKDLQKLGITLTNFVGRAGLQFWYWLEDKDVIA